MSPQPAVAGSLFAGGNVHRFDSRRLHLSRLKVERLHFGLWEDLPLLGGSTLGL
jgi:hypothetical protein